MRGAAGGGGTPAGGSYGNGDTMTQKLTASNGRAVLKNVSRLVTLVKRVQNRNIDLPGMGVFYGPAGFGKTIASLQCATTFGAVVVQVKSVWTAKTLCQAILAEIGIRPAPTISQMLGQICDHLAQLDVPLIIDEADFLVQRKMIELVRDIYEGSGAPVILIGNEQLPQLLQRWERFHSRIMSWVPAEPGDLADARLLAPLYAPGVEIEPALLERLVAASHGSIRRICTNLDLLREFASTRGLARIGGDDWKGQRFNTGEPPAIRRFAGAIGREAAA